MHNNIQHVTPHTNMWFDPDKPFLNSANAVTNSKYVVPPIQFYKHDIVPVKKVEKKVQKYRYHAPDGKKLAAGGILIFEENTLGKGFWLVEEEENSSQGIRTVYTDFGGKYDHNDGDIVATITREFREESYNTEEITYKELKSVNEGNYVYINGYDGFPSYVCIVAHINQFNLNFNSPKIREERVNIIKANPLVPEDWYKTLDVKFILLRDIIAGKKRISTRLSAVLTELKSTRNEELREFFSY